MLYILHSTPRFCRCHVAPTLPVSLLSLMDFSTHFLQAKLASQLSVSPDSLQPSGCPPSQPQELYVLPYRRHSRLPNVCGECWVYEGALPPAVPAAAEGAMYVWRVELEAHKLRPA